MRSPIKSTPNEPEAAPSLLAVGPQRTASSWLDRALREHPRLVFPTDVKETFFFDRYYDRGLEWYWSHFDQYANTSSFAEIGSTYFESKEARLRIHEVNPEAKILVMVRSPIARTFSSFGHEYTKGRVTADFFEALREQPRIINSGRYFALAPEWEETFGYEQVFYLVQEDIEADPQGQLDTVFDFLGLESIELPEELQKRYGQGTVPRFQSLAAAASRLASALRGMGLHRIVEAGKGVGLKKVYSGGDRKAMSMTRPVFDYLLAEHEADMRFLEERLGRSFSHWRNPDTYQLEE